MARGVYGLAEGLKFYKYPKSPEVAPLPYSAFVYAFGIRPTRVGPFSTEAGAVRAAQAFAQDNPGAVVKVEKGA